ncbi:MAG: type I pullulanase, partial [Acetatifactor sp.]|nr:type I pullulanase [Acetatifactor sp.]
MFIYTREFDEQYEYTGQDLGSVCGEKETVFKLWAPLAESVELCLYGEKGEESIFPMKRGERGVWQLDFSKSLHGTYYDYRVRTEGKTVQSADPYARACGCNGRRSMVVDLDRTNPEGFRQDTPPEAKEETVIYELHVKDFSYDPDCGIPKQFRGKYKAFTFPGKGEEPGQAAAGITYLRQLGVTHVHLLPIFDFGWLDEAGDDRQFNWGYDPVNFNVPEGSFATDVTDGTVRIRECKEMIQALHRAGIRVIMDVVYNHMYEKDSWFERTVPGYYCRRWENGELSDGSACGNDIAAGRAMVDNYIADSVLYWAREYHIDGFRFDLMGLLTTELMNRIRRELDAEFGPGEKLLYGEPWRAGNSPMEKGTHPVLKENIDKLPDSIAIFSDDTR